GIRDDLVTGVQTCTLPIWGRLATVKAEVRTRLEAFIHEQVDKQTEREFGVLFDEGKVLFYLECAECRFEIPNSVRIESKGGGARSDERRVGNESGGSEGGG